MRVKYDMIPEDLMTKINKNELKAIESMKRQIEDNPTASEQNLSM